MEVDTPSQPLEPFSSVYVLQIIKDAQQKNGLRHNDYQRYRAYCGRRIRRVRSALNFNHQHKCLPKRRAKFHLKPVTVDAITDPRFFEILIFEVERCWAYAMHLKYDILDDPLSRKKFHMKNKLRKALKHANDLEQIAKNSSRIDATTKLEVQAYQAFIGATLCLELKQWSNAADLYRSVKKIYEKLSDVVKRPELVDLYVQRCKEVQNTLKLCEYNSGNASAAPISELLQLSLSTTSDLTHEFDKLIAEAASKNVSLNTVEWGGITTQITNSNVKPIVDASAVLDEQINTTDNFDDKIELYERFLGNIRDVIQKLNEENRKAGGDTSGSTLTSIQVTISYLEYLRLKRANERYLVLIASVKKSGETGDRKVKPQDFLRLYSQIIENCQEIVELPGASNDQKIIDVYQFKSEYYKAYKCFYMAETYNLLGQYGKAFALYDRASERQKKSSKILGNLNHADVTETKSDLVELENKISTGSLSAKTNQISENTGELEEVKTNAKEPLIRLLDEWAAPEFAKQKEINVNLVDCPPPLEPMPCKPSFFDLALNRIQMPNLQKRLDQLADQEKSTSAPSSSKSAAKKGKQQPTQQSEQEQSGLGGYVKSLFWGK